MNIQAVILAGGRGTRLKPLSDTIPKSMIPVFKKPFLEYQVKMLKKNGFRDFVFLIGYLGEQIENYFGNGERFGVKIEYSYEDKPLGTGGALRKVEVKLKENFFLIYGDSYLPIDYKKVLHEFELYDTDGMIVLYNSREDTGVRKNVAMGNDKNIIKYNKKVEDNELQYIEAGVSVFKKDTIKWIPVSKFVSLEEEIFPMLIAHKRLKGYVTEQRFYDIGTIDRLKVFEKYLLNVKEVL